MGMNRFPLISSKSYASMYRAGEPVYASLELNQVAFPQTGMVESQMPLSSAFDATAPCENGMWVVADKAAGEITPPSAVTDKLIGIVYTTEKEYDSYHIGLQNFHQVAGQYPRVGHLSVGDTVTTNCLQYNTSNFADAAAIDTWFATPTNVAYVVIPASTTLSKAIPELVKTLPANYAGTYGKVVKYYTMPNGEKGIKYQIVALG